MHRRNGATRRYVRSLLIALVLLVSAQVLYAAEPENTKGFRKAVTLPGIMQHLEAFQAIADANDTTRLSGTPGYDQSAQYVYNMLAAAGYSPRFEEFNFLLVGDNTPPVLEAISPFAASYVNGNDFSTMTYSGSGEATAAVTAVDLQLPPTGGITSGCEASDFAGFPAGNIALIQRGTCTFRLKADNAAAAGASAVIIFNSGLPGSVASFAGTLSPPLHPLAVVGTSFAVGQALSNGIPNGPTGVVAHVRVDTVAEERPTRNVIAETPGGDPNNVIVVGAHVDSVSRGPGMNDNGSGAAAILEVAEQYALQGRDHRNKVRFMWYAAEEHGLLGARYYVANLPEAERAKIRLMLNFDMIGSSNYVRFVYDGDNSAFPPGQGSADGPNGSGEIERIFTEYFASEGLATSETPFSGRSDYGPFIDVGIPAGGLFTGAEGVKTAELAATYGGTAGAPFDPCYHLACDTLSNLNTEVLDQNADAIAHTVLYFAKRNFAKLPLIDPAAGSARVAEQSAQAAQNAELYPAHDQEYVTE